MEGRSAGEREGYLQMHRAISLILQIHSNITLFYLYRYLFQSIFGILGTFSWTPLNLQCDCRTFMAISSFFKRLNILSAFRCQYLQI